MREQLLSNEQMARFVDEGYLRLDAVIPDDLCRRFQAETDEGRYGLMDRDHVFHQPLAGKLAGVWRDTALREILALPAVAGLVTSLVGPEPLYDHHVNHVTQPDNPLRRPGGNWIHQDHVADLRPFTFDAVLSIFPHAVTKAMGGTLLIPGSQYRRPHDNNHYRYQHVRGSVQVECPAGTIVAWHGALWHSGRPNRSDRTRTMFKLRLNPTAPQVRRWDTTGLESFDPLPIFRRGQPWMSNFLLEFLHRARCWRHVTGGAAFDYDGCLKRLSIAFDADLADPRYRLPVAEAMPALAPPSRPAPRLVG